MVYSKGKLIKDLKMLGIRKGNKYGAEVALEHLKYPDIINLWYKHTR